MEKTRDFQFFMTVEDEKAFCKALREFNQNIFFLDVTPTPNPDINARLVECVTALPDSTHFSIVNFDLIDKKLLSTRYKVYGEYYHFFQLGRAQMQFLRAHPDINYKGCLQHGRIADSYDTEDEIEKKWKNKVYSILKKSGQKVYWYYPLPDGTREIAPKFENRLVAYPDAVKNYNGKDCRFMIHSIAKFVPEGVSLDELN